MIYAMIKGPFSYIGAPSTNWIFVILRIGCVTFVIAPAPIIAICETNMSKLSKKKPFYKIENVPTCYGSGSA